MPRTTAQRAFNSGNETAARSGSKLGSQLFVVCRRAVSRSAYVAARACAWTTVIVVCLSSAGCCRVLGLAYRTTRGEPLIYCDNCDRRRSLALYATWAEEAWMQEAAHCDAASPDYVVGFRDGFIDYVYAGGTGEPPPVPPRLYWNVGLRRPEGKARANDWFAGFRHGARIARDGGYREMGTVRGMLTNYPREPRNTEPYAPPEDLNTPPVGPRNPFSSEDPIETLHDPAMTRGSSEPAMPPPHAQPEIVPPQPPANETPLQEIPAEHRNDSPTPQQPPTRNGHPANSNRETSVHDQALDSPTPTELELPQDGNARRPIPAAAPGWKPVNQNTAHGHSASTNKSAACLTISHEASVIQPPRTPSGTSIRIVSSSGETPDNQSPRIPSLDAVNQALLTSATGDSYESPAATSTNQVGNSIEPGVTTSHTSGPCESATNTLLFKH